MTEAFQAYKVGLIKRRMEDEITADVGEYLQGFAIFTRKTQTHAHYKLTARLKNNGVYIETEQSVQLDTLFEWDIDEVEDRGAEGGMHFAAAISKAAHEGELDE
jgi:hypothetical protein